MALPQPLHIFRKDLTHLWPETLVVLALFAAFAWSAPSGWQNSPYASFAPILAGFLRLLMPISWLVVISRLIQDEPLVGDRQFWTSRPYSWGSLLLAKILYLVVFLYVPFLLMQCFLLKHAGLYPTTAIGPLLHNLLLLTVIVVVPLTAIAAVTSTFARMLLSVLGALIYVVILAVAFGFLTLQHMPPPQLQPLLIGIFILLPAIALVYQYATRKTLNARIMLLATPLVIFLIVLITPAGALIRAAYKPATGSSDPKLGSLPDQLAPKAPKPGKLFTLQNTVILQLPFSASSVDKDSNYSIGGASVTVDAPGTHYVSPYTAANGQFNSATPYAQVGVALPLDVFNKVKSTPADVHLSLATVHLKAEPIQTWKATLLPFAVPGHGICTYPPDDPNGNPSCRYPFETPVLNAVSGPLTIDCTTEGQARKLEGQTALNAPPSLLDFDPVITVPMNLRPQQQLPEGVSLRLCPGTPLNFIVAKDEGKQRFEVDQKQLVLDNYAIRRPDPADAQRLRQAPEPPQ